MHDYWTWFDVDVASGLNAHIRHLADSLEENSCLYIRYLDKPVEIPVHKRCFKTKPTIIAPLIRTSDVGRSELEEIQDLLDSKAFPLGLRRSPKKNFLNQITVRLPINNSSYPLHLRTVLEVVAEIIGEEMPSRVVIGYDNVKFSEPLPGSIQFRSKAGTIGYKLGKKLGTMLNDD